MPSSHSHALIYDAIGKTDAFREAMEYLVDYYKTHGNLQDEQCKRLLRKMAARAGVGIGPLVSFVRLEGNVGNEGVDYGKASEEFNQQKEMPHITNSKKTSSRRRAAELSPTPPPLQQGENADNPTPDSPFFQWLDQWHTQLQEKYPSIKNSVYGVIKNSNYDMNNADKELAIDAPAAERQQQYRQQRQQKMPSRSAPAQQAPAQQAPAQQAPAQQAPAQQAPAQQAPAQSKFNPNSQYAKWLAQQGQAPPAASRRTKMGYRKDDPIPVRESADMQHWAHRFSKTYMIPEEKVFQLLEKHQGNTVETEQEIFQSLTEKDKEAIRHRSRFLGGSRKQKSNQPNSKGNIPMANRRAKLDIMTGFSNIEKIDGDQGAKGSGYFPKWTTVGLPDQGRNDALDDDQQKTGSGAPETSFPGAPLKTPMEADDVKRPKIREGREASRSRALRKVASEIRLLSPVLSRRLLAAAEELSYDDLSTAALPVSGDEPNEVDDHQDGGGHGTLAFFGTDAAKATSLTRKSSRRVKANPCEVKEVEDGFILVNDAGEKVKGPFKSESEAHEAKVKLVEEGEDENRSGTMQYASQRRKLSSRRQAADKKDNNIDVSHALAFVKKVLDGENYDRGAVSRLWENESKRVSDLLSGNQTTPAQAAAPHVANGDTRTASRRRKARAQGDAPLKPISAPPDEDGVGADGAGGFAHKSKAPLQKSMNADDVKRPRIRENPEASKSLWAAFKHIITKRGDVGGTWNDGRYTISSRDYGNTLEVSASVKDREGIHMPVGSMTISLINDSPSGRFASVELNDGLVENRVLEFTMKPKTASRIASWIFKEASDISKETLEHVGVS